MEATIDIKNLSEEQVRQLTNQLLEEIDKRDNTIKRLALRNEQLTHELSVLKRHKYSHTSEQGGSLQLKLLSELFDEDLIAIETEHQANMAEQDPSHKKKQPKRQALPADLPRTDIHHDPDSTTCQCGCQMQHIGDDVSEKLDYEPGTFSVERHIRSKWACKTCETVTQAPVAPHIIDKGIPTNNLLAQVLIAKYADHQPLYRQQEIYQRAGVGIARSTLSAWVGRCGVALEPLAEALRTALLNDAVLHADETPVPMLAPGKKKTHKAYIWAYASTPWSPTQAVVYDFQPGRSGQVRPPETSWATGKAS